ncbi:MAG TPA: ATP-binding protein [Saprospiraceae bacterium]|nr:ATP-binding protein [Saprospiraceae bacterium]HPI06564.1 ATP-binding protein [Saprospiraceae bacterium]
MRVILQTCGAVLILTCTAFFAYEYYSFLRTTRIQLSTLGKVIASNSTAALAFDNREDASTLLSALKAEPHIVAACLYDEAGNVFSTYPEGISVDVFPQRPGADGYIYTGTYLEGFEPSVEGNKKLGTLYLKSDMEAMYARFQLYGRIAFLVIVGSFFFAFFLSRRLQKTISDPIHSLADTARSISEHKDYGVRATKSNVDELGLLTDAFNQMLTQIEAQNSAITAFNQQLEQKVHQRTAQLEQAKDEMEVINNKLVKSNRDLEQFAYVASHDLQEPLRKIHTFTEMAEKKALDQEQQKLYFQKIKSSAKRMSELITAVLNYSRLSRTAEEFADTDLNIVVENIKTDFELLISEKNATIENKGLPVIKGISLQLHQLCLNLISNALKFTEQQPVIQITSRVVSAEDISRMTGWVANGNYAELVFKDNGIGFDQQYAQKIFTIFQRLHDKHSYAGTGIGLALCKKIVDNHNGFITAQSEVGKGSAFYIYLPV